jgi:hypothetical protein
MECPLKVHVLKACSPAWYYWEMVELLRDGVEWKEVRTLEISGPWLLPVSCFLTTTK